MSGMTPDAAGIVAQVDAGLIIALAVEAKPSRSSNESQHNMIKTEEIPKNSPNEPRITHAWVYLLGLLGLLLSLGITLPSVAYGKPLHGVAEHVAVDAVSLGVLPLFMSAIDRLMPQVRGFRL